MRLSYTLNDVAMADLTDFKRGMIVGACLAAALVTETANVSGRPKSTISAVMTAYTKVGKMGTGKHNRRRNRKPTDKDGRVLKRIVVRKPQQSLSKIKSNISRISF